MAESAVIAGISLRFDTDPIELEPGNRFIEHLAVSGCLGYFNSYIGAYKIVFHLKGVGVEFLNHAMTGV